MIPKILRPKVNIPHFRRCALAQRRKMNTRSTLHTAPQTSKGIEAPQAGQQIVIVGGGIVGAATAHYLSELGEAGNTTIIERCRVACAASGKAGGFLALDWSDGTRLRGLARTSYRLHQELADRFGADKLGYRPVHTLAVTGTETPSSKAKAGPGQELIPSWLDGNVTTAASLGGPDTTAQVNPYSLTTTLVEHAQQQGAKLIEGTVTGLDLDDAKKVKGVHVNGQTVPAAIVVLCMGPWTDIAARDWGLQLPRVQGLKAHSLIYSPTLPKDAPGPPEHCLFTSFGYKSGKEAEPEIYPRPDGTVYVCGEGGDPEFLDDDPEKVTVEDDRCANLARAAVSLSSMLEGSSVTARQACNLPVGPDAVPVIGAVPGVQGIYVATGHSCWGILNGPATGKALAEQIVYGRSKSVDMKPFSPARFF